jgi:hypothetical protein
MLAGAELVGPNSDESGEKYLSLTFNTDSGKEEIRIDVSDLIDYYSAGDGLDINGKTFKVKVDETSNKYLQVTTNGISVSQEFINKINELDNTVLESAKSYADGLAGNYDKQGAADTALESAKSYTDTVNNAMDLRVKELESIKHDEFALAENVYDKDTANSTFVKVENFNEFSQELETKLVGIETGAQVNKIENIEVNGVNATITDKNATIKIEADDIELGTAITSNEQELYGSTSKLSTVLQGIQDSITVAVSGGLVGVDAGDGIETSTVNANKQTVSVKVSLDANNLIQIGTDGGVFAAMYYDGDDAE